MPEIEIVDTLLRPDMLDAVVSLGDAFREKLGLFPRRAFEERAQAGEILLAVSGSTLAGYLLYRVAKISPRRVSITHLCIAPAFRGQGISRRLVDDLKLRTRDLAGIRLCCRRDYPENTLWPCLGFRLVGDKPGRGRGHEQLNIWWFEHGAPLLTFLERAIAEEQIIATLDANVVFDFGSSEPSSEESHPLLNDWVRERLYLCVTPELAAEIDRQDNPTVRQQSLALARRLPTLSRDEGLFDVTYSTLCRLLGEPTTENERSDRRQIAWAVTSASEYFVTRDEALLDMRPSIQADVDIAIVRPAEIIAMVDGIVREADYQPRRFEGSHLSVRRPSAVEEPELIEAYFDHSSGEKKSQFLQTVRSLFSRSNTTRILEIRDHAHKPLALLASSANGNRTTIELLRAGHDRLAPTVLRQLLTSMLAACRHHVAEVTDHSITPAVTRALLDTNFLPAGSSWYKLCLNYCGPTSEVASVLQSALDMLDTRGVGHGLEQVERLVERAIGDGNVAQRLQLERHLSPAKFTDLDIPCFIVPIRPYWAEQLFDTALASQTLLGLPPELGFSLENAYYRSGRPRILVAPGRILWYVSKDAKYVGAGAIRAASYLDEVVIDTPKALFSRFRRLGVYTWQNVLKTAKGKLDSPIMALRFSGTELLGSPISRADLQKALEARSGRGNPIASPIQITNELFFALYSRGTQPDHERRQ